MPPFSPPLHTSLRGDQGVGSVATVVQIRDLVVVLREEFHLLNNVDLTVTKLLEEETLKDGKALRDQTTELHGSIHNLEEANWNLREWVHELERVVATALITSYPN